MMAIEIKYKQETIKVFLPISKEEFISFSEDENAKLIGMAILIEMLRRKNFEDVRNILKKWKLR